jgi:hypothetical protein
MFALALLVVDDADDTDDTKEGDEAMHDTETGEEAIEDLEHLAARSSLYISRIF